MAKFKYLKDRATTVGGYAFKPGLATNVDDERLIGKLSSNSAFERVGNKSKTAKVEEVSADVEDQDAA